MLPRKGAVTAGDLDLAREALVAELGAAREVGLAALLDLGALQLREWARVAKGRARNPLRFSISFLRKGGHLV